MKKPLINQADRFLMRIDDKFSNRMNYILTVSRIKRNIHEYILQNYIIFQVISIILGITVITLFILDEIPT